MPRPLCVLVVDDDPDGRQVLARLLALSGHEVHAAGTVADAMDLATRITFDLLIADLGLPDGTGMDVLGGIRKLYFCPAIALTGHAEAEYADAARAAGFICRVVKPTTFQDLLAAMDEAIRAANVNGPPCQPLQDTGTKFASAERKKARTRESARTRAHGDQPNRGKQQRGNPRQAANQPTAGSQRSRPS